MKKERRMVIARLSSRLPYVRLGLCVLVLGGISSSFGSSYSPGVGIPDPASRWSGLAPVEATRPVDPASWPSAATAGYYYIDNTDGKATDSSNAYGCPNRPRLTMPTSLSAGAVVVVKGGPYSPANYTLNWIGTASSPIWVSGDPTNRTRFSNVWRFKTGAYVFLENLMWTNASGPGLDLRPGANGELIEHFAIRSCEVVGTGVASGNNALFAAGHPYDTPIHDVVYYKCLAHDGGDWQSLTENDMHAFGIGTQMHDFWWINCTNYHMGGDGFGNGHGANHTTYNLYIDGCESHHNRENAVDLKEVHSVVVSGCHFHSFTNSSSSIGEAVVIHYGPTPGNGTRDIWLVNNRIHDSVYGITSTETSNTWWIGNVVWDCHTALSPVEGGGQFRIWNNTVYNCPEGIECGDAIDSVDLRNNIVVASSIANMRVENSTVCAASSASNELYYQPGGTVTIAWVKYYYSVAAWILGTTVGKGSLEQDPLFVNTAADDFELQCGSPAIGAGYDWRPSANASFSSIFRFTPFWKDPAGIDRSTGTLGIGAYEQIRPAPPTNLRITSTAP